ncbi:hypothetical protein STEG23_020474 [Scotinomys teguina]
MYGVLESDNRVYRINKLAAAEQYKNSPNLITLPIFPVWLLANQPFINPVSVTNLYCVRERYRTAGEIISQ